MKARIFILSRAGACLIAVWLLGLAGAAKGRTLAVHGPQAGQPARPATPPGSQSSAPTSPVSKPSESTSAAPASDPTPTLINLEQVKPVLDKLFLAESRIKDLLGTLQTTSWKITDTERQEINQSISLAQQRLQDLEKWRYQYYYHLDNHADAQKIRAAIKSLEPVVASIGTAALQHQGPAAGRQFLEASQDLEQVADRLQPQVLNPPASEENLSSPPPSVPAVEPAAQPTPEPASPTRSVANPPGGSAGVSPPPSSASTMTPGQAKALLDKLFLTESRIKDLMGTLQTTFWKTTDAEHQNIDQSISSAQQKVQDLERWRYQFYYHLDNLADGQKAQAAVESLQPVVASIGAAVVTYQGSAAGNQFLRASQDLARVADQLKPYITEMEARMKELLSPAAKAPGGGPALETEVIKAQPNIKPLTSVITQPPPLSAPQVKQLLYSVYVPAFRIKDLLSQEQPEKWKAPAAGENAFNASRQDLLKSLANLERWRSLFSEHPTDLNSGFQTYVSIDRVLEPLEGVILRVAQYESPRAAANYQKAASGLRAQEDDLLPYLTFLFTHHDQAVQMYLTDLTNCQNQLGFAMHGLRPQATSMKNVLPQFQGRNVRKRKEMEKKSVAKTGTSKKRASSHRSRRKRHHHTTHPSTAASGR